MAILDRVRAIFKTTKQPTTAQEHNEPQRVGDVYGKFTAETTRAGVVRKCREMYANDSRARKMLRVLARDLVKGGFTLKCDDAQALEIAEALRTRLTLDQRLDDWVRLTARDGDSFLELAVDGQLLIADVSRKPTLEMHRDSNSQDTFDDPEKAYWWAGEIWTGQAAPTDAIWFADWQIIHARWEHDEGSRYGSPMMSSGVMAWKRVTEGELDIAVRRKTRAGKKYVHKFPPDTSEATIRAYRAENKDALDNPFAAVADYFGTVDITSIEGDAHLAEIADVLHHIATWFTSGEVPMELVAYGENLNRDVLGEKKAEYDETLEQLREWVTTELVKPLLERQWLLQGIYPPSLTYSIEWKHKRLVTPQDVTAVASAAMQLRLLGVRDAIIWQLLSLYLPELETGDLESGDPQPEGADAERIAAALNNLRGDA